MKNSKKIVAAGLVISFSILNVGQSFAAINTNSPFYYSNKTRQAYINLTDLQREELDRMNTDNNKVLTIEEVLESGKFSLPIKRGVDWIYPFMIDKNKDGQVGENYWGASGSSSSNTNNSTHSTIEKETPEYDYSHELISTPIDEEKDVKKKVTNEDLNELREAISEAKLTLSAVDIILKKAPNFSNKNIVFLRQLAKEAQELIDLGERVLSIYK